MKKNDDLSIPPPFGQKKKILKILNDDVFDWNKWLQMIFIGAGVAISMIGFFWGQIQ
jgi:hypothetical protein